MEPVTTITAIALLASYLKGLTEEAGKQTATGLSESVQGALSRLHALIRGRLSGDDYQRQTLERFQERPDDERRQRSLSDIVDELAEHDIEFARALQTSLAEVSRASGDRLTITDAGAVAVGGDVIQRGHNVAGRDLNISGTDLG